MSVQVERRWFSVDEYYRMIGAGILSEDDRVERAGIPEVWLIDLARDLIEVYARPSSGRYQDFREARRGETLTLGSLPNLAIQVDDILG